MRDRAQAGAEVGEDGLGRAPAADQGALLRRGVAVVARDEQAVAQRDVAAQRAAGGEGGQGVGDLGGVQVHPVVGRRRRRAGASSRRTVGSGTRSAVPRNDDDTSARPSGE